MHGGNSKRWLLKQDKEAEDQHQREWEQDLEALFF